MLSKGSNCGVEGIIVEQWLILEREVKGYLLGGRGIVAESGRESGGTN